MPADEIQALQRRRLAALLESARATPRWGRWLQGRDAADVALADLPVTGKHALMRHFADGVADPRLALPALRAFMADGARAGEPFLGRWWAWHSSGSTGVPGVYVQDMAAMAIYDRLEATRRRQPRPLVRWLDPFALAERFVFVGAVDGHFASFVSVQRLRRAWPWLADRWQCLSILLPLPELTARLDALAPTIVATYPTAAVLLAEEARAGRLRCRPREVWTGGETLTPAMRAHVEAAFDAPVVHSYGASEFLPIAFDCAAGALHVNADWVILEAVDEAHRPVPPGQPSHTTLLTNLANAAQPLLRFDIGDRIVLPPGRCTCGSPWPVVQVQGRRDDVLRVPGRAGHDVALLPLAVVAVLEEEAGAFDFQLRQTAPGVLQLGLGPLAARGRDTGARCRRALAALAQAQGAAPLRITTRRIGALAPGGSGKRQRIVALAR